MKQSRKAILDQTHYGLTIYSHVLQQYYPGETVLSLSGKGCRPARNPFNNHRKTLQLTNHDWIFRFEDTERTDFNGDPFDFARHHYQLEDEALTRKLNEAMNLGLNFPEPNSVEEQLAEHQLPRFSLFRRPVRNTKPYQTITLVEAWNLITSSFYKKRTQELRAIADPREAREFKAGRFDYATFSGTFNSRKDSELIQHSGLLTIDFDHIPQLGELKLGLIADQYFQTELMFVSPSGDGLKWIIPINLSEATHQEWFRAVQNYVRTAYKLEIDQSGKDISRACFLPYDREAYINPIYLRNSFSNQKK